jgi:ubiquinol-cytochrome c reductase cytochrome c1 subunit
LAKDVTTFLSWAAEPEHDERKKYGIKAVIIFSALTLISLYVKRFKWTVLKNRKISKSHDLLIVGLLILFFYRL